MLLRCLKIVWIPLDSEKDDPQAIFESLNDKGIPLTASELLYNYLFRPIIAAKENFEDLHNDKWLAAIRLLENDSRFAVDMDGAFGELVAGMVDADVAIAEVDQAVVAAPAIGVDDGARVDPAADDALEGGL